MQRVMRCCAFLAFPILSPLPSQRLSSLSSSFPVLVPSLLSHFAPHSWLPFPPSLVAPFTQDCPSGITTDPLLIGAQMLLQWKCRGW
eukprot:768137-Hanusia_phi.AAC.7